MEPQRSARWSSAQAFVPTGTFSPVIKQLTETTVGVELAHETAGIGGAAVENILAHPAQFAEESEIGRYAASRASGRLRSFSTGEMETLAKSLARHSALVNCHYVNRSRKVWLVGGRDQIAILAKGAIQKIDQPFFEPRRVSMTKFSMFTDNTLDGALSTIVSLPPGVIGPSI
jgi:hypothetical protein